MKQRNGFVVMAKLIKLVKPLTGYMILAVTMGVLGFICSTFLTIFGGMALLKAPIGDLSLARNLFVLMLIFAFVRGVLRYAEQGCNHYIAFKLLALLRDRVFAVLRRLCPAKLEGRDRGDLISLITSDIELLEVFYAHTISPILIALVMSILLVLFIGSYHWALGLVAAIAYFVVGVILPIIIAKFGGTQALQYRKGAGDLSAFVLDSLRGVGETLQYQDGENRLNTLNKQSMQLRQIEEKMKRNMAWGNSFTNVFITGFSLIIAYVGFVLHRNGSIEFEGLFISFIAMMSSFGPVVALANLGSTLQNTLAAGNRVLDLLEEQPEVEEVEHGKELDFQGASCKNITFAYDGEQVLKDISLEIPKNQTIGIIGKSGSGKSTLLKLLMRFWQVQSGEITLSNIPIDEIQTKSLRDAESFVTQDTHLFHESIESNLKIANPNATHEQVVNACKKASVHDFIMSLPQGYETNVGELGDSLSGGERQRLGIARAFLHDAPFILLDEPTSNLDSLNESVILKALYEERKEKTIVLVSHRESTMRIADTCINVESGRVS